MGNSFDALSDKENRFKEDEDDEKEEFDKIKKCNEKHFQNFHKTHTDAKQPKSTLLMKILYMIQGKIKGFEEEKLNSFDFHQTTDVFLSFCTTSIVNAFSTRSILWRKTVI